MPERTESKWIAVHLSEPLFFYYRGKSRAYFSDSVLFISLPISYNILTRQGGGSCDSKGKNSGVEASGKAGAES